MPRPDVGREKGFARYSWSYFATLCRSVCSLILAATVDILWLQTPLYATMMGNALGVNVGKGVYIDTTRTGDPGLVTIGDNTVLDRSTSILSHATSYTREHGHSIRFSLVEIGRDAYIGPRAVLAEGTCVGASTTVQAGVIRFASSDAEPDLSARPDRI